MINKNKLGMLFGTFLGGCHFVWAWLVLSGLAQPLVNWLFRLHFIEPPYVVLPFSLGLAAGLILATSVTGYLSGWILAAIWNWLLMDSSARSERSAIRSPRHAHSH